LFLVSTSRARHRINSSWWAVVAWWAIATGDVGNTGFIAVVAHVTISAIVLVNLLGPWIVCACFASVQLTLVNLIIGLWWAVMARWTFSGVSLTIFAEVTGLTSNTISNLSGFSNDTLGFKWAWNGHSVTLRAIVTLWALKTSWVRSVVEFWLGAEETSRALLSNDTCTAVASSDTLLAVLVSFIHESTSWADRLTLLGLIANRLSDAKNWCS
jgi:hypothetical protein